MQATPARLTIWTLMCLFAITIAPPHFQEQVEPILMQLALLIALVSGCIVIVYNHDGATK